jgi:hypothetical protein
MDTHNTSGDDSGWGGGGVTLRGGRWRWPKGWGGGNKNSQTKEKINLLVSIRQTVKSHQNREALLVCSFIGDCKLSRFLGQERGKKSMREDNDCIIDKK